MSGMVPEEIYPPKKRRNKKYALAFILLAALVLMAAGTAVVFKLRAGTGVHIPPSIGRQLTFSAYLPGKLPGNYQTVEDSFSYDQGVLVFEAKDDTDATIAFSEQPKPQGFDFDNFYSQQLTDAKDLSDVPFTSVVGKSVQGHVTVLSIVAGNTWVIVSSRSVLSVDDMQLIAQSMRAQN